MVYMVIGWYILGSVISGVAIKKMADKNKKDEENDRFYECCNEVLKCLKVHPCNIFELYGYIHPLYLTKDIEESLVFLIDNNLVAYIPQSCKYYLIKKER